MKKYSLLSLCFLAGALCAFNAGAQDKPSGSGREEIIIRKKGDFPEKMTIQLNGDQVTINGKKPEDVEGNVEVIRRKSEDRSSNSYSFSGPSPSFHRFGEGGQQGGMLFGGDGNKALLGVLTIPSDSSAGARIEEVEKGTPADSAGLQKNDVITQVGTREIHSARDLTDAIGQYEPGDVVTVTYLRDGKQGEAQVVLGRNDNNGRGRMAMPFNQYYFQSPFGNNGSPDNFMRQFRRNHPFLSPQQPGSQPKLGMRVEDRSDHKGVTVRQITPGSAAEAAGFEKGDVVTALGGKEVSGVADVLGILRDHRGDDSLSATIDRDGKKKTLEISLPGTHRSADL